MCFESLTSFHISFIFYQARSPRKSRRLWDAQISLGVQVQEFLMARGLRVVWNFLLINCGHRWSVPNGEETGWHTSGEMQNLRNWPEYLTCLLLSHSRTLQWTQLWTYVIFFFLKFEVCALVLSIVVFKYDSYDKYRQTIWETFKILSLYIQNATLKCEKVEDKMWVRHWKFCDLIPLEVSLHLKGINESILKVVKDLFGWCW